MSSFTGTDGGTIDVARDEHGIYIRAPYRAAHLSADAARRLAAELLALACDADAWMLAAAGQPASGEFTRQFHGPRPKIICLCGSTRFISTWNHHRRQLTNDGYIVLAIEVVTSQSAADDPQHADPGLKRRLDELHKRKIDLADEVLILNVGGYTGESTRSEIEYARRTGKPVRFLEPPGTT